MIKKIIIFVMFIAFPSIVFAQKKHGLFVGVGIYSEKSGLTALDSPTDDAKQMCRAFSEDCSKNNTTLLVNAEATRQNIFKFFRYYQSIAADGDLFVFYFSGHGTLFPDRLSEELDEENALKIVVGKNSSRLGAKTEKYDSAIIPFDSTANTDKKIWRNLILDDELYRIFADFTKKGVRVVFISDSCYSGGQAKTLGFPNKKELEVKDKLGEAKFLDWTSAIGIKNEDDLNKQPLVQKQFKPDPSLVNKYILVASSQDDQPSFSKNPVTGFDASLFTYCFLEVFNQYKKSREPFTFEVISNEVRTMVENEAKKWSMQQSPKVDNSFYKANGSISVF